MDNFNIDRSTDMNLAHVAVTPSDHFLLKADNSSE